MSRYRSRHDAKDGSGTRKDGTDEPVERATVAADVDTVQSGCPTAADAGLAYDDAAQFGERIRALTFHRTWTSAG